MYNPEIVNVNEYLLRQFPMHLTRLSRKNPDSILIDLSYQKDKDREIHENGLKLLVPGGIEIYQLSREYEDKDYFFFLVNPRVARNSPVYLSILPGQTRRYNLSNSAAELLFYPWFDKTATNFIFDRIIRGKTKTLIDGFKPTTKGSHPFSR